MGDGLLERYVRERGGACPSCGYDLAGLTDEKCPECGERLVLRIGMVELRMGLFVCGILGFACGLGFTLTMLGFALHAVVSEPMYGPSIHELLPLMVGLVVSGAGTVFWVAKRGRIRRLAREVRVPLAMSGWVVWVLTLSWFLSSIT